MNEIKEIRREVKKYYGIEYALILVGPDEDEVIESKMSEINDQQWWVLEYTDKSKRLADAVGNNRVGVGFLYQSTHQYKEARMQDKYHAMELVAVDDINWLMDGYVKDRKWLIKEVSLYFYVNIWMIPKRVLFKVKKLIGNQA